MSKSLFLLPINWDQQCHRQVARVSLPGCHVWAPGAAAVSAGQPRLRPTSASLLGHFRWPLETHDHWPPSCQTGLAAALSPGMQLLITPPCSQPQDSPPAALNSSPASCHIKNKYPADDLMGELSEELLPMQFTFEPSSNP